MITLSELASKHNYLTSTPFIFDSNIWEYDISQANINTLRAFNRISDEEYRRLSVSPKMEREIVIGNWIRKDPSIQTDIYKGIEEAKYKLMEEGNIDPNKVIRIANDAVCFSSYINISDLGYKDVYINGNHKVTFRQKGYYTFYMNLKTSNVLFFFGPGDNSGYDVDIIGINNSKLYLHNYFISFIIDIINSYLNGGKSTALINFNKFYNEYINRRLPIEYYREFNALSGYIIRSTYENFVLEYIDQQYINRINIDCNLNILRTIYSYLLAAP